MPQIFNVQDDKVIISNLEVSNIVNDLSVDGNVSVNQDLSVNGSITVDTLTVKKIVTDSNSVPEIGKWFEHTENELSGKGLSWVWGNGSAHLSYRSDNRLWTNANVDLAAKSSYKIDNIEVLSSISLGPSVTKSNLRQVGPLTSLSVTGDVTIAEFAFFNSSLNRLGVGTEDPNAAISVLENDVELSIGSPKIGLGAIGTSSSHDLAIVSDNIPRITVKQNGEVHISNELSKSGVLRVFGTLYADAVVSDTRLERTTPLEFKATHDTSIFGKGLIWTGTGNPRQLIMMPNPDRLWTSESIDLGENQAYYVNGSAVLNEISLGKNVLYSNLIQVGYLESLAVNGNTELFGELHVKSGIVRSEQVVLSNDSNRVTLSTAGIDSDKFISISTNKLDSFYADNHEIVIGDKQTTRRPVKVFGQLAVGVNNPDPSISLSVSGNISFANKKFITGHSAPTDGIFSKGDICWNQYPQEDGYVGWICISEGTPGVWAPFGAIGRHG